jgi:PAS domain S-box-containing protein
MPTEPRFAVGTREIDRLEIADVIDNDEPWTVAQASHHRELASIPHAMFVIGPDERIEDGNALAEALVGYTRAELVGQLIGRVVSDPCSLVTTTPQALETRVRFAPAASGVCVHHRSGRELPASVVLCPHGHGSVALVMPLQVETHDGLRESQVAEIVHDFKNPLATIALEMCLLDDKLGDGGRADLRGAVGRVTHNVEFLDRMVQDMLDSCAIAAGELALQRSPTELRTLLEQVIDRVIATRDRGRVFLEAPAMMMLSIDRLRIERVIANLLQNALKYAPRVSGIVVRLEPAPGLARISVIDSGPGLAPDEVIYIFDKYRRTATARTREGSGLGLYVSKQIIEAHGGHIAVDSVIGIGSRFFFELPVT